MSTRHPVLVVDDDPEQRKLLERCLIRDGCEPRTAADGREAIALLESGFQASLILSDLEMPHADGRAVLAAGMARRIPVVILTGHGTVQTAVDLMRQGAANFLSKPFTPSSLRSVLDDAFGRPRPAAARRPLGSESHPVVGEDPEFLQLIGAIEAVADTEATVLLTGESGTGKEVVARTLHSLSRRASGPFVAVNCGAIPEALLESEMFGHARGAFTGATQSRAGRVQLAEGGTLFLDEIGDMPLPFQVKLLRVLQEREYEVLGESTSRSADVRVIAATHRDLDKRVIEGQFREDLLYRLKVIDLQLPPLRDRKSDIPLLVDHFLSTAGARHGRKVSGMTPEAMDAMVGYRWPGNIRELGNVVERMVVMKRAGGILELSDLPAQVSAAAGAAAPKPKAATGTTELPQTGLDLRMAVAEFEGSLIDQALSRTGGNRNAAAQLLGLNRTTLVEKLRRLKT